MEELADTPSRKPPPTKQPSEDRPTPLTDLDAWIRLAHGKGIGASARHQLLNHFNAPTPIFSASTQALRESGLNERQCQAVACARHSAELATLAQRTQAWLDEPNHHCISLGSPYYPAGLSSIATPPVLLYVSGDPLLLSLPGIAIVGSRQSTAPALAITGQFAATLAQAGLVIISGMALGVDQAAHGAALNVEGLTIAVAGTGLDRVYPARHRSLARAISVHGALVSEFPLGASPQPHHFPRRNRIISGLSLGTVVIEASIKSGTLTTARHALEQGREVMVLPGSVNNPLAKGCHALLKSGATLIESTEDILAEIAPQIDTTTLKAAGSSRQKQQTPHLGQHDNDELLTAMGFDATGVDTLAERTEQPVESVLAALVTLELAGRVARTPGGRYVRC